MAFLKEFVDKLQFLNRTGSFKRKDVLSVGQPGAPNKCVHLSTEFVRNGQVCCKASVYFSGLDPVLIAMSEFN